MDRAVDDSTTAVVFFYFDFRGSEKQTTAGMLLSVVSQLARNTASPPEVFLDLFNKHVQRNTRPLLSELKQLVEELCKKHFRKVHLFLDALDECTERKILLTTLTDMMATEAMSVMVTSRAEHDIIEKLASSPITKVSIGSQDIVEDVRLFVTRNIETEPHLCDLSQELKDEITTSLVKGAKGM
jgi:hypothetical protein